MIAFILVWSAYVLGWTAGGVRGRTSAKLILSTPGRSVAAGRLGPMRALMAGYALLVAVGHALMINKSFYGDLFELEAGCWTVLAGQVVVAVGAAIGPRLPRR
ncbi:hypothetical protein [Pseudonocardia sp. MH-G8]|uniref:hypothetical protein n=1 Tax=Pseudonocardia sp. MH-G8 TaxID=1854588 RepID=UPI000BA03398|nr:hypothetical protein [Pseudonocardia sp. MH-G8]OZM80585.1 hypothetical protein CFP66_20820 [Pseudonocardia sp. MH-G8]